MLSFWKPLKKEEHARTRLISATDVQKKQKIANFLTKLAVLSAYLRDKTLATIPMLEIKRLLPIFKMI